MKKLQENFDKRMNDPATEAQLRWLDHLGHDINKPWTRGEASIIIKTLPVGLKQRLWMEEHGFAAPEGTTIAEFEAVKEQWRKTKKRKYE